MNTYVVMQTLLLTVLRTDFSFKWVWWSVSSLKVMVCGLLFYFLEVRKKFYFVYEKHGMSSMNRKRKMDFSLIRELVYFSSNFNMNILA